MFLITSMRDSVALGCSLYLAVSASVPSQFDEASYSSKDVIKRDVVVVGGGASGTYAAIGLHDKGKSFVLIERSGRLGGQTETYTDPRTGTKVDYGVQAYHNDSITLDFLARLNIPVADFTFGPPSNLVYADFTSGALVKNFTPGTLGSDYVAQLDRYPFLDNGFFLPNTIPQDLLLPWVEYIKKYSLQDSAWATTVARPAPPGKLLELPAIYVFNSFNQVEVSEGSGRDNALVSARNDNSELYKNAFSELKTNILLNSTIIDALRSSTRAGGVKLVVKTPNGKKLVAARQLVLGIPPILDNMKSFGLDSREQSILSKLKGYAYYAGLVSNTGLSDNNNYQNTGSKTQYHVPDYPSFAFFKPTAIKGQFLYWYNALEPKTQTEVESAATTAINNLHALANTSTAAKPRFDAFANHTPFHLYVSVQNIANGFYRDMYSLQGYKNTWYIGALFVIGSSQLWNSTANMLPDIITAAGQ